MEFAVGTDALTIVVSQKNNFINSLTVAQLRDIFTDYDTWAEVDPPFRLNH